MDLAMRSIRCDDRVLNLHERENSTTFSNFYSARASLRQHAVAARSRSAGKFRPATREILDDFIPQLDESIAS